MSFSVEAIAIGDLQPHPRNSRLHGEAQLAALERRFKRLGWYKNIVIARHNKTLTILAGHGIIAGAKRAGEKTAPCHVREIDPNCPEAIDILEGDNTIIELAEDDPEQRLRNLIDLDMAGRLDGTGFDDMDLEALKREINLDIEIALPELPALEPEQPAPAPAPAPAPVTPQPGEAYEPPAEDYTPAPGNTAPANEAYRQADTTATIGSIRFVIDRQEYLDWENELRETMNFDKEKIIAEVRRRLGL